MKWGWKEALACLRASQLRETDRISCVARTLDMSPRIDIARTHTLAPQQYFGAVRRASLVDHHTQLSRIKPFAEQQC